MRASKNLLIFLVFSIFCLTQVTNQGITLDSSQISTSRVTNTVSSLQSTSCRCDKYSSICDDRCCCDTDCPADMISAWKKQGMCLNTEYIYSLSAIPLCSAKRAKTLGDLQAGLRIYYQILKILFCVVFDNSDKTDLFKGFQTDEDIQRDAGIATSATTTINTYVQLISGSSSVRATSARPSFGSTQCNSQPMVLGTNQELSSCFVAVTPADFSTYCSSSSSDSFILPATYSTITVQKGSGSDTVSLTTQVFIRNVTSINGFTRDTPTLSSLSPTATVSGTTCTCTNFVSQVNYRFVLDSNNLITSGAADIVLTPSESFDCSGTSVFFQHKSSVAFLTTSKDYLPLKGPGYKFGDPVLFGVNTSSTTFNMFVEPLNFLYLKSNGECAMVGEAVDFKYSSTLQFGYKNEFSCSLALTSTTFRTFCASQSNLRIFENILNNLKYVGIFPNASPLLIKDWVYITNTLSLSNTNTGLTCTLNPPILTLFYSAFGERNDPGFKINSAQISPADAETITFTASGSATQTFTFKIYVDFVRLPQSSDLFVAPNPTARLSLPDNVLTPFITKK